MKTINTITDLSQETKQFCDQKFNWALENIVNSETSKKKSKDYKPRVGPSAGAMCALDGSTAVTLSATYATRTQMHSESAA